MRGVRKTGSLLPPREKVICWEGGIAPGKGRQLLVRNLPNGGKEAGPTNLPQGREVHA